ncbi:hypothetical protein FUAX_18760 [Fulvitalea axinellae]|uniref:Choice-of-anchor D domain-containing protein n=1 Tax=Fulvitalea axinellae TaxID=1182444 RepID=A0AAU9CSN0_9BACT|nr:hypothetical protein FUAX_18760 [Fulvitalea axinellae]
MRNFLLAVCLVLGFNASKAQFKVVERFSSSDIQNEKSFGNVSARLSGANILAVGAQGDRADAVRSGAVYLFHKGKQLQKLKSPSPSLNQAFGFSLATAGEELYIGAPGMLGFARYSKNKGKLWVAKKNGFGKYEIKEEVESPSSRENDFFGYSIQATKEQLFVSSPKFKSRSQGQVFVYTKAPESGKWQVTEKIEPDTHSRTFGADIFVQKNWMAVTAPWEGNDGQGACYIYKYRNSENRWVYHQKIDGGDRRYLGSDVAIDGDYLAIGSDQAGVCGQVKVFKLDRKADEWKLLKVLEPRSHGAIYGFGTSVSLRNGMLAVGAPRWDDKRGCVYVYDIYGDQVDDLKRVYTSEFHERMSYGARLGHSVRFEENGDLVCGAIGNEYRVGDVLVFRRDCSEPKVEIMHSSDGRAVAPVNLDNDEKLEITYTIGENHYYKEYESRSVKVPNQTSNLKVRKRCSARSSSSWVTLSENETSKGDLRKIADEGNFPLQKSSDGLSVNRQKLDFGTVKVGDGVSVPLDILNKSDHLIPISVEIEGAGTSYSLLRNELKANQNTVMTLTFRPEEEGLVNGFVKIFDKRNNKTHFTTFKGKAYRPKSPQLVLPKRIDLGKVPMGQEYLGELTVRNTGDGELSVSGIDNPSTILKFSETIFTVSPNSERKLTYSLKPKRSGYFSNSVVFRTNSGEGATILPIVANFENGSLRLEVKKFHDLGSLTLGETKKYTVNLKNTGEQAFTIKEIESPSFVKSRVSDLELSKGERATLNLQIKPRVSGRQRFDITLNYGDSIAVMKFVSNVEIGGNSTRIKASGVVISPVFFDQRCLLNLSSLKVGAVDFSIEKIDGKVFYSEIIQDANGKFVNVPLDELKLEKGHYILKVKNKGILKGQGSLLIN